MNAEPSETVIGWIQQFQQGSEDAVAEMWRAYFNRVAAAARRKLGDAPRRVSDEEDVAGSVIRCLCDGAQEGRFDEVSTHDDLWRLLMAITKQKCVDQIRHQTRQKRGGGATRGESVLAAPGAAGPASFDDFLGQEPTPDYLVQMDDQFSQLVERLPDQISRRLVERRMQGWSNEEIAAEAGISVHAVRRKLRLVRSLWAKEIE